MKSTASGDGGYDIIRNIRELGRKEWKKQSGYHKSSLTETAMYRLKMIAYEPQFEMDPGLRRDDRQVELFNKVILICKFPVYKRYSLR
jgi:hypothetical protein